MNIMRIMIFCCWSGHVSWEHHHCAVCFPLCHWPAATPPAQTLLQQEAGVAEVMWPHCLPWLLWHLCLFSHQVRWRLLLPYYSRLMGRVFHPGPVQSAPWGGGGTGRFTHLLCPLHQAASADAGRQQLVLMRGGSAARLPVEKQGIIAHSFPLISLITFANQINPSDGSRLQFEGLVISI